MARPDDPLDAAVPEPDQLEQAQDADPTVGSSPRWPDPATSVADEADQLEQAQEILADPDEDYPPSHRDD